MGGINLSGFARGLASQDPVGMYLRIQEAQLRKQQAANAQQEFDWRKEDQANKTAYRTTAADEMARVGQERYQQADTNQYDDNIPSSERAAYSGMPTTYSQGDAYRAIAAKAARVDPNLGIEYTNKARAEDFREKSIQAGAALQAYRSGDTSKLLSFMGGGAVKYNTHPDFQDGKFASVSPITGKAGNTPPGVRVSFFDSNSGNVKKHDLFGEEQIALAIKQQLAAEFPEAQKDLEQFMQQLTQTELKRREIGAVESNAATNAQQAELRAKAFDRDGDPTFWKNANDTKETNARASSSYASANQANEATRGLRITNNNRVTADRLQDEILDLDRQYSAAIDAGDEKAAAGIRRKAISKHQTLQAANNKIGIVRENAASATPKESEFSKGRIAALNMELDELRNDSKLQKDPDLMRAAVDRTLNFYAQTYGVGPAVQGVSQPKQAPGTMGLENFGKEPVARGVPSTRDSAIQQLDAAIAQTAAEIAQNQNSPQLPALLNKLKVQQEAKLRLYPK